MPVILVSGFLIRVTKKILPSNRGIGVISRVRKIQDEMILPAIVFSGIWLAGIIFWLVLLKSPNGCRLEDADYALASPQKTVEPFPRYYLTLFYVASGAWFLTALAGM